MSSNIPQPSFTQSLPQTAPAPQAAALSQHQLSSTSNTYDIDPTMVSPLEYEVLLEYSKLAQILTNLLQQIYNLKKLDSQQLSENLRVLETKLSLVFTLFKGSVYSLFLQAKMNASNNNNPRADEEEEREKVHEQQQQVPSSSSVGDEETSYTEDSY